MPNNLGGFIIALGVCLIRHWMMTTTTTMVWEAVMKPKSIQHSRITHVGPYRLMNKLMIHNFAIGDFAVQECGQRSLDLILRMHTYNQMTEIVSTAQTIYVIFTSTERAAVNKSFWFHRKGMC